PTILPPPITSSFHHTATTHIYTLSLHDALPISQYLYVAEADLDRPGFEGAKYVFTPPPRGPDQAAVLWRALADDALQAVTSDHRDRKSTRLNSSHLGISYAVFCLTKTRKNPTTE